MKEKHLTQKEWELKQLTNPDKFSDYEKTLHPDTQYMHYISKWNKERGIVEVLSDGMS
jgi:hypothetical protein